MESEVVENKGLPGNGLTDSVSPEEEPLRRSSNSSGKRGGGKKPRKEQISLVSGKKKGDAEDNLSGDEEDGGGGPRQTSKLDVCARKCRLTPKRALIYLVVSSLLIFLLLLILIILIALWPSSPSQPTCQTAQCHKYTGEILGSMNASAEPCQDVWEFGCGGWLQSNPIPESRAYWSAGLEEEGVVKDKVRSLINTLPVQALEESNSVLGKMKRFYDSCMATEYIEADKAKNVERMIKSLGGWQVTRDFRQNDWDFGRVLKKVHGEHRVHVFFEVGVVPDPRVPSRNIIKISPGGLSLADKRFYFELDNKRLEMGRRECSTRCRDYPFDSLHKFFHEKRKSVAESFKFHVKDMVHIFGANSLNAQLFASELFNYEKRIAEITPSPESLRDPVESSHRITVNELKGMSSTIFWPDLLKGMFPKSNINDQTEVIVLSKQYLTDISAIISSTDRPTLNNYVMWHLFKKFLPYLSREYAESYDMFLREISGRRKALPRWEFCIDETLSYFRHAADFLLSENCVDRPEKVDKMGELFESIRQSLVNRINEASEKFDESIRNFFLDKLRLMQVQIGTPFQNGTYLKEYYGQLDVQKNDWITNVKAAIEFQSYIEQRTLTSTQREAPVLQVLSENPNKISFMPTSNQVVVPEAVLQRKVLQLGSNHLPLIMGSVGVELGQAIASAFGIEQGLYGSGGNLMTDKDSKTQTIRDIIDQRRTCLVSFFDNIRLDDRDYIERTSLDTTIHLAGIQLALYALETHELVDTFLGLPALENLPSNALFFLSYVQSQCSEHTLLYHELEHYSFTKLSHDHRTKGLLRQSVRFTEALECPKSAELYADFSCATVL